MSSETFTYNDWLAQQSAPSLREGIARVSSRFSDGIIRRANPHENKFDTKQVADVSQGVLACSPCAVVNGVRALGIDPLTDIDTITTRLYAGHKVQGEKGLPLLVSSPGSDFLWVTQTGIERLLTLVQRPLGQLPLPIRTAKTFDLGTVHEALANGYTAVYVDQLKRHAITVIGMSQQGDKVLWTILPPDSTPVHEIQQVSPDVFVLETQYRVYSERVDPRRIVNRIDLPVWMIGRDENPWIPPPDTKKERSPGEIKIEIDKA